MIYKLERFRFGAHTQQSWPESKEVEFVEMKLQFLLFSVLCIVKGQNYQNQRSYVPVIKDGVPVDTPEVQAAKAAHFEAYERAKILAARRPSTGQYRQKIQQQKYQPTQYQQELEGRQQYHQQEFYQSHVVYGGPEQALAAYSAGNY